MNKTYTGTFLALMLALLLVFAVSCGDGQEEAQPSLEEAKAQAKEAIDSAEILLQGATPGTDLSDARELLDQARDLYVRAMVAEDYVGPDRSVLTLVEEAKGKARQAMEAEKL
jgi:hypothetical protein